MSIRSHPFARTRRVALWATCLLVIVPTTLEALVFSVFAFAWGFDALFRPGDLELSRRAGALFTFALLGASWIGTGTLWRLFSGLVHGVLPARPRRVWLGLAAGCVACLVMVLSTPGAIPKAIVGWPLLAALHLGIELRRAG